jgi:D-inositol-3-phosphate glycosyltransferase
MTAILFIVNKGIRPKLVYTSHAVRRDKASSTLNDRMVLALENFLVKRVRKFVVLNEINKVKVIAQAGLSSQDVFVVPIGVDVEQYKPNLDADDVGQRYNFHGKTNILFVGRICAEKGLEYLIKAADILVNKQGNSGLRFLLVGPVEQFDTKNGVKSKYMSKITGLMESSGLHDVVRMTGAVPVADLKKLYSASDIVVVPSIVDLDPQVLLEAMATGKPVIGTRVGAIPWRIVDGKSGFVIDPASEKQLAEKIQYLLDNPAEKKRMGDNGRKIVGEEYSAEKMAERTLSVYQSIE